MDIKFSPAVFGSADVWALPVTSDKKLSTILTKDLGKATADTLKKVIQSHTTFLGERDQFLWIHGLGTGEKASSILLYGIGSSQKSFTTPDNLKLGGLLAAQAKASGVVDLHVLVPEKAIAADIALGARLRSYQFADYKTKGIDKKTPELKKITFHTQDIKAAQSQWKQQSAIADGVFLARDMMNQPPNICTPDGFVKTTQKRMAGLPVTFKVLNKNAIDKLGMGAIQAVSRGNRNDAYVLIAEYKGTTKQKSSPLALVGKGVTFDTGGYNIKPGVGSGWTMGDMKYDMGGAAAVMGTVMALAQSKAPVHVVGIVGLTENMIDEDAYLPSEVITTLSGQTVEVIDTDAEGRLVMADLLTYVQRQYKAKTIIDIATLTGAVIVALGSEYAGLLSPSDAMADKIFQSGVQTGEKCWRLPMDAAPMATLKNSLVADMVNVDLGRLAGGSFAALFLSQFVEDDVIWAHIDIAGLMRYKSDTAFCPAGAIGFGVRLLVDYTLNNHA